MADETPVVYGEIVQIFKSPALLGTEDSDRINVVVKFNDDTAKAVYTDEANEILALTTQKGYGVYFNVADNSEITFVSGGVDVIGYLHFASLTVDDTEDETVEDNQ